MSQLERDPKETSTDQCVVERLSVAIPVAAPRHSLAFRGTNVGVAWAHSSSAGTLWHGLAGMVTESPLPYGFAPF